MRKQFFYFLLLGSLFLILVHGVNAQADPLYHGIDISQYQGVINFNEVADDDIDIVIIRASFGLETDPYFELNWQNAMDTDLMIGYYHSMVAQTVDEAIAEADYFYSLIQTLPMHVRPIMDYETFEDLSVFQINQNAIAFLTRLETLSGITPALYTDSYNAENLWSESLTRYPLWIANYSVELPVYIGAWSSWAGFQYSDMGMIYGIADFVDLDLFTNAMLLEPKNFPDHDDEYAQHIVVPGDTLSQIAYEHATTLRWLLYHNTIANPNLIYPGERITIPDLEDVYLYTVRRGDTLWALSIRFHVSIETIADNNLIENPNLIFRGQLLLIPKT